MTAPDTETRNQTVASMYLGVRVALNEVDAALEEDEQALFARAFEEAAEAVKSVLKESSCDYVVEAF